MTLVCRGGTVAGWVALLLVLLLVSVSLGGCRKEREEAASPWDTAVARADELWPRPAVLGQYEQLLAMYQNGRGEAALPLLRCVVNEPLRLAPDRAWGTDPDTYHWAYVSGRLLPAMKVLRAVWAQNRDYAAKLNKEGRKSDALAALCLNVSLARQIVHIEPTCPSGTPLIGGTGLWCSTWNALHDELIASGQPGLAQQAASCAARAKTFSQRHIRPWVDKGAGEAEQLQGGVVESPDNERDREADRRVLEMMERDQLEVRRLTELWDTEVDGLHCRQLVMAIELLARKPSACSN